MKRLLLVFAAIAVLSACDPDSLRPLYDPREPGVTSAPFTQDQVSVSAETESVVPQCPESDVPVFPAPLPAPFGKTESTSVEEANPFYTVKPANFRK